MIVLVDYNLRNFAILPKVLVLPQHRLLVTNTMRQSYHVYQIFLHHSNVDLEASDARGLEINCRNKQTASNKMRQRLQKNVLKPKSARG